MLVGGMGGSDRALRSMPLTERYSDCFSFQRETIPGNLFHFPVAVGKKKKVLMQSCVGKKGLNLTLRECNLEGGTRAKAGWWFVFKFTLNYLS